MFAAVGTPTAVISLPASLADRRAVRYLDALAVLWTLLWIVIGYLVYRDVRALTSLSNTVVITGRALQSTSARSAPSPGSR